MCIRLLLLLLLPLLLLTPQEEITLSRSSYLSSSRLYPHHLMPQLDEEYGRECDEAALQAANASDAGQRNHFVMRKLSCFCDVM